MYDVVISEVDYELELNWRISLRIKIFNRKYLE